jgi:XRE family transcriptional regulator, regulator of sulfur utilization
MPNGTAEAAMTGTEQPGNSLLASAAANLQRLRRQRGLSLAELARFSGLEEGELTEVEAGTLFPAIDAIWKLAGVLGVPFGALLGEETGSRTTVMRRAEADVLVSSRGRFTSRALFPLNGASRAEFYEIRLGPGVIERAAAHPPGTSENLIVVRGTAVIEADGGTHLLNEGDAIFFFADGDHAYLNGGAGDLILHLVMTYSALDAD